jgi:hypothetical protein
MEIHLLNILKKWKKQPVKVSEKKGIKINVCGKHEILFQRFCFVASASKLRKMAKQKHFQLL